MSFFKTRFNRRDFLKISGGLGLLLPVAKTFAQTPAEPTKPVDPNDPMVKALSYVDSVSKVDKKKSPTYKDGNICGSCMHFTPRTGGLGKCAIIPSGLVAQAGWCAGWVAKPK